VAPRAERPARRAPTRPPGEGGRPFPRRRSRPPFHGPRRTPARPRRRDRGPARGGTLQRNPRVSTSRSSGLPFPSGGASFRDRDPREVSGSRGAGKEARPGSVDPRGLNPDQSSRIGISRSIVTRRKARRAASAPFSIFSLRAPFIRSGGRAPLRGSRSPGSVRTPSSPRSRERRGRCRTGPPPARGVRPPSPGNAETSSTCASPTVCSFNPSRTFTRGETSWYMSLSEETMTTSIPRSSARRDKVR